jgi:1-acyl-sn-glycerol-3-phosphate acyltransferase
MLGFIKHLWRNAWGAYAWAVFVFFSLATTLIVAVLPGLQARRQVARLGSRLIFLFSGVPLRVRGTGLLPAEACVVVANHASYLDGVILTAALPPSFSFVVKREMTSVPLAHLLLRRLGSEFVDRFDSHRGASDARRIFRKARRGDALAFFPEGTFYVEPGLRRFRTGAFAAAARADLPVVPVVIRGARRLLPAEQWLPRNGAIDVEITAPIVIPASTGGHRASRLLQAARGRILEHLDEPDKLATK